MSDDPRERFRQLLGSGLQSAQRARADAIVSLFDSGEAFAHAAGAIVTSALLNGQLTKGLYEFAKNQPDPSTTKLVELGARLEKRVGSGSINLVTLLNGLAPATRRICQILVAGEREGTGFLVGPGLVLTNYHVVIAALGTPDQIECQFDCWDDALFRAETNPRVPVRAVVAKRPPPPDEHPGAPASPRPIDYALLALARRPSVEREHYRLAEAAQPLDGAKVVVVGHPSVGPLSVSCSVATHLESAPYDPDRVFYDADTEPGSSGSLCLVVQRGTLLPVALHRGADVQGQNRNFGVPLTRINADLVAQEVELKELGTAERDRVAAPDFDRLDAESLSKLLIALPGAPITEAHRRGASASDACAHLAKVLRESWREEWNEAAALVQKVSTQRPVLQVSAETMEEDDPPDRIPEPSPDPEPPRWYGLPGWFVIATVVAIGGFSVALLWDPVRAAYESLFPAPVEPGTLIVEGAEPGLLVLVDGEERGRTTTAAFETGVGAGTHAIELRNTEGARVRLDHVSVWPGEPLELSLPSSRPVTECVRVGAEPEHQIVLVTAHGADRVGDVCDALARVWGAARAGSGGVRVQLLDLQLRREGCEDACPDEGRSLLATLPAHGIDAQGVDALVLLTAGFEPEATADEAPLWRLTLPTDTSGRVMAIAHVIGRSLGLRALPLPEGTTHAWTPMVWGAAGPVRWSAADRVRLSCAQPGRVEPSPSERTLSIGGVAEIEVNGAHFLLEARSPAGDGGDEGAPERGLLVWNRRSGALEAWLGRDEERATVAPAPRSDERVALTWGAFELRFVEWRGESAVYVFEARVQRDAGVDAARACNESQLNDELRSFLGRALAQGPSASWATATAGRTRFRDVDVTVRGMGELQTAAIAAAIEGYTLKQSLRNMCNGQDADTRR